MLAACLGSNSETDQNANLNYRDSKWRLYKTLGHRAEARTLLRRCVIGPRGVLAKILDTVDTSRPSMVKVREEDTPMPTSSTRTVQRREGRREEK